MMVLACALSPMARMDAALGPMIAVACGAGTDQVRLVRQRDMHRLCIGRGIDRDGADGETPRGADDPARDLAAVGDQNFVEHRSDPLSHVVMAGLVPAIPFVLARSCLPFRDSRDKPGYDK
jgi:hypothetical protein